MEIKITDKLSQQVLSIDGKTSLASTEVIIGEEQPDEGKLWIDTGEISNLGTEVVDSVNGKQTNKAPSVRAVVQDLVSILYPVGSIYMSTNATNPKDLFGIGEWEQIKDTFLMSAGNTYGAGTTGGTASHTHSIGHTHGVPGVAHTHTTGNHTLTTDEMPNHSHWGIIGANGVERMAGYGTGTAHTGTINEMTDVAWESLHTGNSGGGGAHNHGDTGSTTPTTTTTNSQSTSISGSTSNLPPYLVVYTWKRVS
jgi:hypothetical protein